MTFHTQRIYAEYCPCHAKWHSHGVPRLPRDLHVCTTWRSPGLGFAKSTQHDTSKVLHLPRIMKMDTSKVLRLPRKMKLIFWKRCKSIAPVAQNDFWHITVWNASDCHEVPSLPPETKLRNVSNLQKHSCSTPHRHSHSDLVANSCERWLQTVANITLKSSVERTRPGAALHRVLLKLEFNSFAQLQCHSPRRGWDI